MKKHDASYTYIMNQVQIENTKNIFIWVYSPTMIKTCVEYCIKDIESRTDMSMINRHLNSLLRCYSNYAKLILSTLKENKNGESSYSRYISGLYYNSNKPDYCIHH